METKLIEVRDSGTRMLVMGIKFRDCTEWEQRTLRATGWGGDPDSQGSYIILVVLSDGGVERAASDPYHWVSDNRTLFLIHAWLRETNDHWDSLPSEHALLDARTLLYEKEPAPAEFL